VSGIFGPGWDVSEWEMERAVVRCGCGTLSDTGEESEGWMASVVQAVNQAFVVAPLCPSLSVGRWVPYLRSGSLWLLPAG